jgi:sporulation protein YlmC with PRC-barrel domain
MLTSKELSSKPVITISDGRRLGEVKDLYLDGDVRQSVGIYLGTEGLLKRKEMMIPRESIQVSGVDVWLVSNGEAVISKDQLADSAGFTLVSSLRGREIQTDGGTKLGVVEDVLLDNDLRVLGFSLSKVYAQGPIAEKKAIARDAITSLGSKDEPMLADLVQAESLTIAEG